MIATVAGRILPSALAEVNKAVARVRPEGDAARALDKVRGALADVAVTRVQVENKLRMIQAHATRGRGMSRADLDRALDEVVKELKRL